MHLHPWHDLLRAIAVAAAVFVVSMLSVVEADAAPGYCVRFAPDSGALDEAARTAVLEGVTAAGILPSASRALYSFPWQVAACS